MEIRLNELNPVVDKFVLVESTKTFQKQDKPIFYAENKDRFKQFSEKIIHVVVDKFPVFSFTQFRRFTPWDYSNYQKNQIQTHCIHSQIGTPIVQPIRKNILNRYKQKHKKKCMAKRYVRWKIFQIDYVISLQIIKQEQVREATKRATVQQMSERNRIENTGGWQSGMAADPGFMTGAGTSAEMGSFNRGGLATLWPR